MRIIESITPDVLRSLQERGFFAELDHVFCPQKSMTAAQVWSGDFRQAKRTLQHCGFEKSDWPDVFHLLMGQGAFCDCEILYNAATESRLKSHYWQRRAHETRQLVGVKVCVKGTTEENKPVSSASFLSDLPSLK